MPHRHRVCGTRCPSVQTALIRLPAVLLVFRKAHTVHSLCTVAGCAPPQLNDLQNPLNTSSTLQAHVLWTYSLAPGYPLLCTEQQDLVGSAFIHVCQRVKLEDISGLLGKQTERAIPLIRPCAKPLTICHV